MEAAAEPGVRVVGREAELAALDEFLAAEQARGALVLTGGAGIGKTTIVRAALSRAASAGLRVFLARPTSGEMELPYVGLADLLGTVATDTLAVLAAPQRASIEGALVREGSSAAVDRHALSRGVLELLRLEGAGGDLLIAVDDVQWLDRSTASAMTFALRRLGPVPIRVLVAARTANGAPAELPFGLGEWEGVRRIEIGPLSTTDLGAMVRERLGKQLPRPRLNALRRASGGNPLHALELAEQDPGVGTGSRPSRLSLAVEERLRTVDADARKALSVASASLRPSVDLLLRAGVERTELRSALETGIVESDGMRLSFAHPLLGEGAYELLLPDERREIHARLAAVSTDVVERGHHVSRATVDRDESAAEALDRAADEAANLGDHAGAAAFRLRAAELSLDPDGQAANWREVGAAYELVLAGDVEAAVALARDLIDRLPRGVARAEARRILIDCSAGAGFSYEDGLAQLDLTLDDAMGDEAMQAELHLAMTEFSSGMCRLEDAVGHARTAIELAEHAGASAIAVGALAELGFAECMLGQGVSEAARTAFVRWDQSLVLPNNYSPRMALALAFLHTLAFDDAEELLEQELAMAEERGLEPVEVMARAHLAEVQLRAGHWAKALANARVAVEHARQAANAQVLTGACYPLAMTEAVLGRHNEACGIAGEALAEAEATQDFWFIISHRAVLGLVALAEDDAQAAVDLLEPAWALMLERGLGDLSIFPVAHVFGEALVAVGRLDDAVAVAKTLRSCPVGERPWCRATASRLAALAASASGDQDAARSAIAAALEAHSELPEPFEHARTLQICGRIERSARNWGAARSALVDALERFDTLGAARWAEKTSGDIARLPGRRPTAKGALTATEERIARLVGDGLSNKEIAAELYVTVHTVEKHLSHAYAKLGVRSRAQLAGRLAAPT